MRNYLCTILSLPFLTTTINLAFTVFSAYVLRRQLTGPQLVRVHVEGDSKIDAYKCQVKVPVKITMACESYREVFSPSLNISFTDVATNLPYNGLVRVYLDNSFYLQTGSCLSCQYAHYSSETRRVALIIDNLSQQRVDDFTCYMILEVPNTVKLIT